MKTQKIRFSPDRKPMPRKIKLGFEGDNMVERLAFDLPVIADSQTATLMLGGAYANAVQLTEGGEDYFINLTAEIVGAEGEIEAYVRIDGAGGEVWQSDLITLITGDVPDVEVEIEQRFPTAVETMLQGMAQHSAEMEQQAQRAEEAAELSGGYYTPEVDGGTLTWTASKPAMPALPSADIRGPRGADGDPGVYMGADEPTDPDVKVWIDPTGQADVPSGGGSGGIIRETDPTVPDWAKQPNKPTYTAEEVGALPKDTPIPEPYVLPTASDMVKGGVIIGSDFIMDGETLKVKPEPEYELIERIFVGYTLLAEKPEDWNANYSAYYGVVSDKLTALESDKAWEPYVYYAATGESVNAVNRTSKPNGTLYNFRKVYVEVTTLAHTEKIPGVIGCGTINVVYNPQMVLTDARGCITKCYMGIDCGMLNAKAVSSYNFDYATNENVTSYLYQKCFGGLIKDAITAVKVFLVGADKYFSVGTAIKIMGVRA